MVKLFKKPAKAVRKNNSPKKKKQVRVEWKTGKKVR